MSLSIAIALLGLGLAFIIAEILFPSMGVLTLLAAGCLIASVATAFAIDGSTGVRFLVAAGLLVPAAMFVGFKLFPRSPVGKHMVARGLSFESKAATDERDLALEGHTGIVDSPLRPAGMARIDGRRVDVVSRGEMIDVGVPVRVVEVKGNRVVVARDSSASETSE